jgi:putative chitinase
VVLEQKGLNALADSKDYETMTKRINGGLIGLDDRKAKIAKAFQVLG